MQLRKFTVESGREIADNNYRNSDNAVDRAYHYCAVVFGINANRAKQAANLGAFGE